MWLIIWLFLWFFMELLLSPIMCMHEYTAVFYSLFSIWFSWYKIDFSFCTEALVLNNSSFFSLSMWLVHFIAKNIYYCMKNCLHVSILDLFCFWGIFFSVVLVVVFNRCYIFACFFFLLMFFVATVNEIHT